jgi:26S proteasome regulatory subunit N1
MQMHYGEPSIRKAVPLALGLTCASNPLVSVLDTLGKYSHDADAEVAHSAILAMGLVGCGTNNARLAQMLRQLAGYYAKDASNLFVVRLAQVGTRIKLAESHATSERTFCLMLFMFPTFPRHFIYQGLLHMGKGTVTINPFHSNRQLMSPVAVAGLLTVLMSFTDVKNRKSPIISASKPWNLQLTFSFFFLFQ